VTDVSTTPLSNRQARTACLREGSPT
jgi:hypothetical protein